LFSLGNERFAEKTNFKEQILNEYDLEVFNRFSLLYCEEELELSNRENENDSNNENDSINEGNIESDKANINKNSNERDTNAANTNTELTSEIELKDLNKFYIQYKNNLKMAHININSVRHKFDPLREILIAGFVDILFIQETKLDDTFPSAQFNVAGFKTIRQDFKSNSGGLMTIVRDDLTHNRRKDLEMNEILNSGRVEMIVLELILKNEKWLFISLYKQPKVTDRDFAAFLDDYIIRLKRDCHNLVLTGDLNIDFNSRNITINDILDINGVCNIVKAPTCFKGQKPTIIDVVISNVHKRLQGVTCFDTGLSDFHRMVLFATKCHNQVRQPQRITYRSYKHFEKNSYIDDINGAPFHVGEIFDSVDDSYWFYNQLMKQIIDDHAPLKTRIIRHSQIPYMNGELRKTINYKNHLRRKFEKNNTPQNWEIFRKYRNYVTKLRKHCKKEYIKRKCSVKGNGKEFWDKIKPLISDKCRTGQNNIILSENENVINDQNMVGDIFNDFFSIMLHPLLVGDHQILQIFKMAKIIMNILSK